MIRIPKIGEKTHMFNLPRRMIRYWLYRFKKEAEEGTPSNGSPEGLKDYFEKIPGFSGFSEFAVSWDIPHLEDCKKSKTQFNVCSCTRQIVPLQIVYRQFSIQEEWRATIRAEAPVLQLKGKHKPSQASVMSKGS